VARALALLAVLPWSSLCQQPFEAIPKDSGAKYHVDFARHLFASPEAEKADRANLYSALKDLEALKGKVASSADNLQRALQLNDSVRVLLYRHHAYLYLRHAVNTADESSMAENSTISAEVDARTAFLRQEVIQIEDQTLAALIAQKPSLKIQLYAIEDIRRYRPYTLSLKKKNCSAQQRRWTATGKTIFTKSCGRSMTPNPQAVQAKKVAKKNSSRITPHRRRNATCMPSRLCEAPQRVTTGQDCVISLTRPTKLISTAIGAEPMWMICWNGSPDKPICLSATSGSALTT